MSQALFSEFTFIRKGTIRIVSGLTEEQIEKIPSGFPHNIHWNIGHIYVISERFYARITNSEPYFPDRIHTYFEPGTSPAGWDSSVPSIETIIQLLENQLERYKAVDQTTLDQQVQDPYTTSSGYTLNTANEFFRFGFYHEGMHIGIMKSILKLVKTS
ncbi:DinB family protein [Metabacillus litoralis]|uniref:DinB family protein n=1 Tax=Metabacillus litoralis TaxID=152268 RepID=A0A5C6VJK3_9BACI|nr:DinB family protein [Metabacillus litoralis]TXC85762.1 DinB family protein [Metabacillus litoralis]